MQVIRNRKVFDVCIVGSGAGGGMAAKVLTEAGADVVMLEAGIMWDSARDSKMFAWSYDGPHRGAAIPSRQFGEFDAGLGGWTLDGEPFTTGPGSRFDWFRTRMLGGRTNHWGRISLRFGPDDFRRRSLDGLGDDWPISYDDLKPYYDEVDRLVGIFGSVEGLPNEPDGIFLPPPRPRCYELLIKQAADALKITCIPSRLSILTRPHNGRKACHYCGQCGRGCAIHANFSSPSVLLPPALATGRLTLVTRAMAREVTTDESGLATGVSYIDTSTGRENHVRARIVVLAASACESARLLLNSRSSQFPRGLANSSGTVGRYLTDTTGVAVGGFIPKLMNGVPHNEDGASGMHLYMPWWLDNRTLDFPRGYRIEIGGGRRMPGAGFLSNIHRSTGTDADGQPVSPAGYGKALKDDYRRFYGARVGFSGRGEMIPNEHSYCEIDPAVVDRWGIPVLRFHFKWTDYEVNQVRHMQQTFRALINQMGGTPLTPMPGREAGYGIEPGGRIIHEVGVTRMGHSPTTSVVNAQCQAHDVKNLFVADGGPFVTNADKNVTWTILALAMRTSTHIVEQRKAGGDLMAVIDRRLMLRLLGSAPLAAGFAWTGEEVAAAHEVAQAAARFGTAKPFQPKFFTSHEWETVRALVDAIIPRDERSGSATDAGVPEFMDFILIDEPRLAEETSRQTAMRGGLAWIDLECQRRFDKTFVTCTDAERTALLDDISKPPAIDASTTASDDVPTLPTLDGPEGPSLRTSHGRAFFASFRDLTATGFWTTKIGMDDLQFMGNRYVAEWTGCPDEALKKLGVGY